MYTMESLGKSTIAMVLAGGKGERLSPLTLRRPKPSVPFGGKYKIIDFVLSNLFNSAIKKVYILTQYRAYSLNKHIRESWGKWTGLGEFYVAISPETSSESEEWFKGTADAILQYLRFVESSDADFVAIFGGDHIYKMDYLKFLDYHIDNAADLSISCIEVPKDEASRFGIVGVDDKYNALSFIEKPANPPQIPDKPGFSFVNMGIYVFNANVLREVLQEMDSKKIKNHDFGQHVIPYMVESKLKVVAYKFLDENKKTQPYWKDIGTLDSYYAANMDLISVIPEFNLYDPDWPLRTYQYQYPPAKTVSHEGERVGRTLNSLVCDGTIVSGGLVERSLLGSNVKVNSYSYVTDSIIMNNVTIGRHARIRRAIIDKNVIIPEGYEIGFDLEGDKKKFTVTETGIVVIAKNTVLPE